MTVTLPMPISLWKAYRGNGKRRHRTPEYESYIARSFIDLQKQNFTLPSNGCWAVELFFHSQVWLTKKKKIAKVDLENRIKCLLDTVVKYCEAKDIDFDDSQIVQLGAWKVYDEIQNRVVIKFTPMFFP